MCFIVGAVLCIIGIIINTIFGKHMLQRIGKSLIYYVVPTFEKAACVLRFISRILLQLSTVYELVT